MKNEMTYSEDGALVIVDVFLPFAFLRLLIAALLATLFVLSGVLREFYVHSGQLPHNGSSFLLALTHS